MSDGIYSALSGAVAQERNLSVVANNLANVNTVGFKADRSVFHEVLTTTRSAPIVAPSLRYVNVADVAIDHQPGAFKLTGRTLDAAIHGDAYFVIETPRGERYTRAGSFVMDAEGVLRTPNGYRVLGDAGLPIVKGVELKVPDDARVVSINPDGTLRADKNDIGKFKLVRFVEGDLLKDGLTWFVPTNGAQPLAAAETVSVEQGYLESANANAVTEVIELITLTRSFEAMQKVIETFRELDNRTARDVGGRA